MWLFVPGHQLRSITVRVSSVTAGNPWATVAGGSYLSNAYLHSVTSMTDVVSSGRYKLEGCFCHSLGFLWNILL